MQEVREFHSPNTISEAVSLLKKKGSAAVAGGTDLAIDIGPEIRYLVDITRLGLNKIQSKGDASSIGATVTMDDLVSSKTIRGIADGILAEAAGSFISEQIRNAATVGGNLARSSPAADLPPALLVLDAVVEAQGVEGKKRIPLSGFFKGPGKNVLNHGLLLRVLIPKSAGRRGSFQKLGRTAEDLAIVNAAVSLRAAEGRCEDVRIALGAVGPTPMRIPEAEAVLEGSVPTEALVRRAADIVQRKVKPADDHRASAAYRRKVSGVLARRGLENCLRLAGLLERGEG